MDNNTNHLFEIRTPDLRADEWFQLVAPNHIVAGSLGRSSFARYLEIDVADLAIDIHVVDLGPTDLPATTLADIIALYTD